jgi:voltage-gated potassium channel
MTQELWRARTEWPLAAVSIVFLVVYSVQVIAPPGGAASLIESLFWIIWAIFLADYIVLLSLAERRGRWFVRNLHELAIVALPMLRPLRLLRLITLLRVLNRAGSRSLRGHAVMYVIGSSVILCYVSALAVLDTERAADDANITSFSDAIWWSITTITTVGYGDRYPVTELGRVIAAALMVGGIAVLGVVTASLASWLIEAVSEETAAEVESSDNHIRQELAEVKQKLDALMDQMGEKPR